VYLKDGELPEGFALLEGALEGSLGKIEPGSSAQHKYVVVPSKGSFGLRLKPAQVTYVAEIDSTDRQVRCRGCCALPARQGVRQGSARRTAAAAAARAAGP
jgi:hypothetical protein